MTSADPPREAELAALEAALAGEPVAPEHGELVALVEAVRGERPQMSPAFVDRLEQQLEGYRPARARHRRPLLTGLAAACSLLLVAVVLAALAPWQDDPGPDSVSQSTGAAERSVAPGGGAATDDPIGPSASPARPGAPGAPATLSRPRRSVRSAALTLATAPGELEDVGDRIVRATDSLGGFVISSSVSSTDGGGGGGLFELSVPAARLNAALAAFSRLAHVRARTQGEQDVTAPYENARDRLQDARALRRSLLRRLAAASTENAAASLRRRRRLVSGQIAAAKAQLRSTRARSAAAIVSVTLEADRARKSDEGGGYWSPGDAAGDSLRVLGAVAGGLLVALAALGPLALLGAAAWALSRALRRRGREAALEA